MLNKIKASNNKRIFLFIPYAAIIMAALLFLVGCGCSSSNNSTSGMDVAWENSPHTVLFSKNKVCFQTSGKYDVHITQRDSMTRDNVSQQGHSETSYGTTRIFFVPDEAGTHTIRLWTTKDSTDEFVIKVQVTDSNDELVIEKISVTEEHR